MPQETAYLTAQQLLAGYRAKELSPVRVIEDLFRRIERLEPVLNAFQLLDREAAAAAAQASERRWERGEPMGPLDGIPISIKDIVMVKGWPMRSGSLTTSDAPCEADAPAPARLREAGAILFGKTTTSEFGWKGMTSTGLAGITRNPWDPQVTPGGSSGGAGAAVAAGLGPLAHGNDGGGSIRIPASYCGLYGIKPSFARVPQFPNDSPFTTLVSNGPLARCVADAALMLEVIGAPDGRDWLAMINEGWQPARELEAGVAGLRIGLSLELGGASPWPEIAAAVRDAADRFADLGAEVEDAGPLIDPLRPVFEDYWKAGFARVLSMVPEDRRHLMESRLRELGEEGQAVGVKELLDAHAARAALAARFAEVFTRYDLLLTPTMPTPAPPVETPYHSQAFDRWRDAVPYTVPFNLTGLPAASIPCGLTGAGLPIGLQIVGPRGGESAILRASRAFERDRGAVWPQPELQESLARIAASSVKES